jgi:CubicO group peptidase (beta-lactamase class C family)
MSDDNRVALPGDAAVSVTVRHLLCHGGGLSVHGFPGYRQDQALPSLADILDGRPPSHTPAVRREGPPGREWRYSGGGSQVLQQLLEDVTGRAFADLAEELVLGPAGMTTATYAQPDPADAAAPHIAGRPEAWMIYPEHAAAGCGACLPTCCTWPRPFGQRWRATPERSFRKSSPGRW